MLNSLGFLAWVMMGDGGTELGLVWDTLGLRCLRSVLVNIARRQLNECMCQELKTKSIQITDLKISFLDSLFMPISFVDERNGG